MEAMAEYIQRLAKEALGICRGGGARIKGAWC